MITFMAAAGILAITGMLVLELYINSSASRGEIRLEFPDHSKPGTRSTISSARCPLFTERVVTSFLALLMGIPLGVGAAIFLAELAPPKISDALTFLIELLAAVPSVIYGLLGIFVLVPILREIEPYLKRRARLDSVL